VTEAVGWRWSCRCLIQNMAAGKISWRRAADALELGDKLRGFVERGSYLLKKVVT